MNASHMYETCEPVFDITILCMYECEPHAFIRTYAIKSIDLECHNHHWFCDVCMIHTDIKVGT